MITNFVLVFFESVLFLNNFMCLTCGLASSAIALRAARLGRAASLDQVCCVFRWWWWGRWFRITNSNRTIMVVSRKKQNGRSVVQKTHTHTHIFFESLMCWKGKLLLCFFLYLKNISIYLDGGCFNQLGQGTDASPGGERGVYDAPPTEALPRMRRDSPRVV